MMHLHEQLFVLRVALCLDALNLDWQRRFAVIAKMLSASHRCCRADCQREYYHYQFSHFDFFVSVYSNLSSPGI